MAKQFVPLTILGAVLERKEVYAWAETQLLQRFTSDGCIPSNIRNLSFAGTLNKPVYTKTEDITVTKTYPSPLIFGGRNFQMKWTKK